MTHADHHGSREMNMIFCDTLVCNIKKSQMLGMKWITRRQKGQLLTIT